MLENPNFYILMTIVLVSCLFLFLFFLFFVQPARLVTKNSFMTPLKFTQQDLGKKFRILKQEEDKILCQFTFMGKVWYECPEINFQESKAKVGKTANCTVVMPDYGLLSIQIDDPDFKVHLYVAVL